MASTDPSAAPRKKKMVKRKPARQQVEVGQIKMKAPEQTGQTFNVWYGKWAGGDKYDAYGAQEKAQTRVVIATDAGYTRADGGAKNAYCCLFFARGCCPYGSECSFLHRLPPDQSALPDTSRDVFGREKHADYRDDMGGVGSFSRQNRTLYVGKIKEGRNTAETVENHFEEFGDIERIRILQARGVAFVTYVSELNAQFAKEAMSNQSLDEGEVINVRWATTDPNPTAAIAEQANLVAQGEAGIARGLDPEFVQAVREMDELEGIVEARVFDNESGDYDGDVRSAKRARIEPAAEDVGAPLAIEAPVVVPVVEKPSGLLSANALESLKYMASLRAQIPVKAPVKVAAVSGLGGLAAYGSDDDEDDA